jgi:hypothetical protein
MEVNNMRGIFVNGVRPKSKKAIKEAAKEDASKVTIENTSLFGGFHGPLNNAPVGTYDFVGPDPYNKRSFYGNIIVKADGRIIIK